MKKVKYFSNKCSLAFNHHPTSSTWSKGHRKSGIHTLMSAKGPPENRDPAEPALR